MIMRDSLLRVGVRIDLAELGPRALLTVQVRVPQDQLFVLDRIARVPYFCPSLSLGPETALQQLILVHLQLSQERGSHLQILPPRVDELKCLEHAPPILPHDEGSDDKACSILRFLALDEHTFVILDALVHEVEDLVRYLLRFVEEHLLLVILPVQGQILNIYAVPMIIELHAGRVDYTLHFIGDDEFEVLGSVLVTNE